jgi:hypothetical protein
LPDPSLSAKWYSDDPRYSVPPPSLQPPPPQPIGDPTWSTLLGAVAGGLGGFMMLLAAQFVAYMQHSKYDFVVLSASAAKRVAMGKVFPGQAFVLPVVCGVVLGALLGYMSRRLIRVVPRLLFFGLLLPIITIFVHAFVIRRLAPGVAETLPFGPLAVGALVYGVFLAVVSPLRVR